VQELGLTLVPSFTDLPGEDTWVLAGGRVVGDGMPWGNGADVASYAAADRAFAALAATGGPR